MINSKHTICHKARLCHCTLGRVNFAFHADGNREFNLSGAHPKMSKQAVLERRQQQQHADDLTYRPNASAPRGRSQSASRQRPIGDQRLEQLARPKTTHWDKCKYVCPPTFVLPGFTHGTYAF